MSISKALQCRATSLLNSCRFRSHFWVKSSSTVWKGSRMRPQGSSSQLGSTSRYREISCAGPLFEWSRPSGFGEQRCKSAGSTSWRRRFSGWSLTSCGFRTLIGSQTICSSKRGRREKPRRGAKWWLLSCMRVCVWPRTLRLFDWSAVGRLSFYSYLYYLHFSKVKYR